MYLSKCILVKIGLFVRAVARRLGCRASLRGFLTGRHDERMVDASARRADEGRGNAAKSVGEPLTGNDPAISEWGNPTASAVTPVMGEGTGGTEPSQYLEEEKAFP
jgi:hypothetical protein